MTFVPEHQLVALLNVINRDFPQANVTITDELRESGLIINFDDCPDLRPGWLGHSNSRAQYMSWTENLTMPKQGQITDDRTLQAFREKMELATEIAKNKSKAVKAKRQTENIANRQNMASSLLRAQRYLGLLAKAESSLLPDIVAKISISPLEHDKPSPFLCDQDVLFIAVDVEAYERPPRMITEVGVATLDTRDLKYQAPGKVGEDWQQLIRARHFRIAEYKHYVNTEFVQGCPDRFEFGKSEFVGKDNIGNELAQCFDQPYSGTTTDTDEKRNIILVGHDVSQDINYLQQVGFNILNSGNLIDKIDTAELFRVHTKDPNPRSLGSILYEFDLMGWHLHNAGNDAVYTIWAMLATCVKAASDRGSDDERKKREENLEKRTETAVEQAKQRVQDEFDGWETKDEDGGVSVPPAAGEKKRKSESNRGLFTIGGAPLDL